eukprot:4655446-Pyramimonas_sp.AAC.1
MGCGASTPANVQNPKVESSSHPSGHSPIPPAVSLKVDAELPVPVKLKVRTMRVLSLSDTSGFADSAPAEPAPAPAPVPNRSELEDYGDNAKTKEVPAA